MADEDGFLEDDVAAGQDLEVGQKMGFLPAVTLKILKWGVLGLVAIIFIVTVVVVTVSIINRGAQPQALPSMSQEYVGKTPTYSTFDAIPEIRTRTMDDNPATVIVKVVLGYDEGNKAVQGELVKRTTQITDWLRNYFSEKREKDLIPKNDRVLKNEIKDHINRVLTTGQVREVYFVDFNVIAF